VVEVKYFVIEKQGYYCLEC